MELVNQTVAILQQGAELMKNPAIGGAVSGVFNWLKDVLGKKSAKEKLELLEQNKHNEDTIAGLKANLEFILEDNKDLQKQLAEKVKEVELLMKENGVDNSVKISTVNVSNSTDTKIAQDIDTGGGDLTIN